MGMSDARKNLEKLRAEIAMRFDDPKEGRRVARTITDVEQLLVLSRRYDGPHRADKANLLLCNYHLLQPESFGEREHVLQMARRHLRHLSSGYSWAKKLEAYMEDETRAFRMFDMVDGNIVRRQTAFGEGPDEGERREDLYMACVLEPIPCKSRGPQAKAGVRHTYWAKPERKMRDNPRSASDTPPRSPRAVSIPPAMLEMAKAAESRKVNDIPHKGVRPAITFTLDELISAAREMGELTWWVSWDRANPCSPTSSPTPALNAGCAWRRCTTPSPMSSSRSSCLRASASRPPRSSPRTAGSSTSMSSRQKPAACCWTTPWRDTWRRPACWTAWPNMRTLQPVTAIAPALASRTHGATGAPALSSTYAPRNPWPARRSARAWSSPRPRALR